MQYLASVVPLKASLAFRLNKFTSLAQSKYREHFS